MANKYPDWLKMRVRNGQDMTSVKKMLDRLSLHTVCEEANCPNILECFGKMTATFMILGKICTRNCTFCNVSKGKANSPDLEEPLHVAQAVEELGLKHVVITSVTRDDLPDGGASHYTEVIEKIRKIRPQTIIEVLIPDFQGNIKSLIKVVNAKPDIINHNIETVPRLYPTVRPMAVYQRSLELLSHAKDLDKQILTKSGIMLGLGEVKNEVIESLEDLRKIDCDFLTIGQYLAPSNKHHPIVEYIHPDIFAEYKNIGEKMGFKYVASAPLVRSSYNAEEAMNRIQASLK